MKDYCQFEYWLTLVHTDYYRCRIHDEVVSELQLNEMINAGEDVSVFKTKPEPQASDKR